MFLRSYCDENFFEEFKYPSDEPQRFNYSKNSIAISTNHSSDEGQEKKINDFITPLNFIKSTNVAIMNVHEILQIKNDFEKRCESLKNKIVTNEFINSNIKEFALNENYDSRIMFIVNLYNEIIFKNNETILFSNPSTGIPLRDVLKNKFILFLKLDKRKNIKNSIESSLILFHGKLLMLKNKIENLNNFEKYSDPSYSITQTIHYLIVENIKLYPFSMK
jgi:hypothetical protein